MCIYIYVIHTYNTTQYTCIYNIYDIHMCVHVFKGVNVFKGQWLAMDMVSPVPFILFFSEFLTALEHTEWVRLAGQ